ncbi:histidine phosphatase family protein [Candidatus Woesearchaeota archaeon]|nr:histidine phosphatase family protein [Candidatus Woesearchaeota archaeon]
MKFYVVRHPWTESNVKKITQGWADSPLIPEGVEMAERLANFLKNKSISKIFTSDLGRCIQTSEIINKILKVDICKIKKLREQNFGKFNGLDKEIIKKEFDETNHSAIPSDGESLLQMKDRVLGYIKNELPRKENNVLIVTHTGCFQSILSDALKIDLTSEECHTNPLTICLFELTNKNIKLIERFDID